MDNTVQPVRVRIAPSPTGNLHVGTARAALYNELFARHNKGTFIVRIEDTDPTRSKSEFEQNILDGLRWLGLKWEEGPDIGGPYGPYRQSERGDTYVEALRHLLDTKQAYLCDCNQADKSNPVCVCSSKDVAIARLEELPIKLRVTQESVTFQDIVRGSVTAKTETFGGDFIIARSLHNPVFHLAVVVDDHHMQISHVIRGEDHISNTAKHVLLQQALGYLTPIYAHLPLLLDEQRKKLSKRRGNTDLLSYREAGYLPQTMLNYLALQGWNPGHEQEFFSHDELIKEFTLERVQKGGAIFSLTKLNAMNKYYVRLLPIDSLVELAKPFLGKTGLATMNPERLKKAMTVDQERIETLAQIPDLLSFFADNWQADYEPSLLIWKKSDQAATAKVMGLLVQKTALLGQNDFTPEWIQKLFMDWIDTNQLDRGEVLWPMRVALTGKEHSPSPFEVAAVLGKQETVRRLELAKQKLAS